MTDSKDRKAGFRPKTDSAGKPETSKAPAAPQGAPMPPNAGPQMPGMPQGGPGPRMMGQRRGKKPTKKTVVNEYMKQIESLRKAMGQILQIASSGDQRLAQEQASAQQWLEKVAFKLDAVTELIIEKTELGITKDEIKKKSDELWIKDFEKGAREDDTKRGLVDLPAGSKAKAGDVMTTQLWVSDENGKPMEDMSRLRVRFNIGRAEFSPEFDNHLTGMSVGETKEFELAMPPMSSFAGMKLTFKVKALEIKTMPVPPSKETQEKEPTDGKKENK